MCPNSFIYQILPYITLFVYNKWHCRDTSSLSMSHLVSVFRNTLVCHRCYCVHSYCFRRVETSSLSCLGYYPFHPLSLFSPPVTFEFHPCFFRLIHVSYWIPYWNWIPYWTSSFFSFKLSVHFESKSNVSLLRTYLEVMPQPSTQNLLKLSSL